ncbi:hypothetical protein TCAL_03945, partial [Tigriopus californicus]
MVNWCAVPFCRNQASIGFPKDPLLRKAWCIAIRRVHPIRKTLWKPSYHHKICRSHFLPTDFNASKRFQSGISTHSECWRLKPEAIPSIFRFPTKSTSTEVRSKAAKASRTQRSLQPGQSRLLGPPNNTKSADNQHDALGWDHNYSHFLDEPIQHDPCGEGLDVIDPLGDPKITTAGQISPEPHEEEAQTLWPSPMDPLLVLLPSAEATTPGPDLCLNAPINVSCETGVKSEPESWTVEEKPHDPIEIQELPIQGRRFGIDEMRSKPSTLLYYSGFQSYDLFCQFIAQLGPDLNHLRHPLVKLSIQDEFLLTVMKLRQNKDYFELAVFFDIDESVAEEIFHTWLGFMFKELQKEDTWQGVKAVIPRRESSLTIKDEANSKPRAKTMNNPSNPTLKVMLGINSEGLVTHTSGIQNGFESDHQLMDRVDSRCPSNIVEKSYNITGDKLISVKYCLGEKEGKIHPPVLFKNFPKRNFRLNKDSRRVVIGLDRTNKDRQRKNSLQKHIDKVTDLSKAFKILSQGLKSFSLENG